MQSMIDALQNASTGLATVLLGIATGAAWITTIAAPNCSYDRLDAGRADGHVRQLLKDTSTPLMLLLIAAAALAFLGGALGAGVTALLAGFGFYSNRWTLAPAKKGSKPPGVRRKRKTERVVAVSLSLIFAVVTLIAAVMAVFEI